VEIESLREDRYRDASCAGSFQRGVQNTFGGGEVHFPVDGFVLKLNSAGSALIFSTYLGGSGGDVAKAIAVDTSGNVYVTGRADSPNFPLKNALQSTLLGNSDAFVTNINPSGTALIFSTLLGGHGAELANRVSQWTRPATCLSRGIPTLPIFPCRTHFNLGTVGRRTLLSRS
jgi:hypothetical protein